MKRVLFLVVILMAMGLAGCGGPTATPTPTSTPPHPTPTPTPEPTPTPITVSGIVEALTPSTVLIYAEFPDAAYTGTGIIYDESGLTVTNAHVVEGAAIIKAYVQGIDRWLSARLVGISTCEDLAVIDISGEGYAPATLGESDEMMLGEDVIALGYPLASALGAELTINRGVVSKLHAQLDELEDLLQTDTDINPGNSGGPLVNMRGEVIGINSLKFEYTAAGRPVTGLNFAIPSSHAKPIIERLASGENLFWMGTNAITNDADVAWYFDLPVEEGLFIYGVSDNSPAADAGIEAGDVVITMKGIDVSTMADVCDILRTNPEGNSIAVQVMRGTKVLEGEIWGEKLSVAAEVGPTIGLFTFAEAVDENENCINPANSFPSATPQIYACFDYSGMQDGMAQRMVWLRDGEIIKEVSDTWVGGEEGNWWWRWGPEEGYTTGNYEVQFYVEGQLEQSGTFTITAAAVSPIIGPFAFAEAVDENNNCINLATSFASGTPQVYTCFDYADMQDGMAVGMIWLRDGEIYKEDRDTWRWDEEGGLWWRLGPKEGGLDPGDYEVQLYVEGQLAQSGTFTVLGAEASPTTEGLLYSDDFSDPSSGWDVYSDEDSDKGYSDGEYYILVKTTDLVSWGNPGRTFTDFRLEVDARKVAGPDDNQFGVIARYRDSDNFYVFAISSDGYYRVRKQVDDEWETLVEWTTSPHIKQGESTNHLTLIAQGADFGFYVNGEHLVDVTDASFTEGDTGLVAGTFDEAGVRIHFDNLEVWGLP